MNEQDTDHALEIKAEPCMTAYSAANAKKRGRASYLNHLGRLFGGKLRKGFCLNSSVSLHNCEQSEIIITIHSV